MSSPHWVANLGAYAVQVGLLLTVGLVLPRLLEVRQPLLRLRYWQGLLAVTLLLPLLQPRRSLEPGVGVLATITLRAKAAVPVVEANLETFPWLPLLLLVAGVALGRLLWLVVGLWTLGRYRREASELYPLPPAVEAIEERLATRAEILLSDRVSAPVTFGWWRPVILVPNAFLRMTPGEQRGIACHELLHVRRRDWPAVILEEILKSLTWFHPAVWILLGRIALSREQVVDREVVRITREKRTYLEALWSIARVRRPSAALVGLAFYQRSQLFHRVAMMTREVPLSRPRLLLTISALLGLLGLTLMVGTAAFPLITAPEPAVIEEQPRVGEKSPAEEPSRQEPRRIEGDVIEPRAIYKLLPTYPAAAVQARAQGLVVMESVITTQGEVVEVKVLKADREDLAAAAVMAIRQWRFEPATLNGQPVDVYYNLTVNFRLT